MKSAAFLILAILLFGGCEDPAKRVKSDPNATAPQKTYEQGRIETH